VSRFRNGNAARGGSSFEERMNIWRCCNMVTLQWCAAGLNLETAVEYIRVPANGLTTKPAELWSFLTGDNTKVRRAENCGHQRTDRLRPEDDPQIPFESERATQVSAEAGTAGQTGIVQTVSGAHAGRCVYAMVLLGEFRERDYTGG
jgi:hypothetical protein